MTRDTDWIISSRSGGNGGSCFQARRFGDQVEVRNSKDPAKLTIRFSPAEFASFLDGAKEGEFDNLR